MSLVQEFKCQNCGDTNEVEIRRHGIRGNGAHYKIKKLSPLHKVILELLTNPIRSYDFSSFFLYLRGYIQDHPELDIEPPAKTTVSARLSELAGQRPPLIFRDHLNIRINAKIMEFRYVEQPTLQVA